MVGQLALLIERNLKSEISEFGKIANLVRKLGRVMAWVLGVAHVGRSFLMDRNCGGAPSSGKTQRILAPGHECSKIPDPAGLNSVLVVGALFQCYFTEEKEA